MSSENSTPDLAAVLQTIMSHPELVAQIAALTQNGGAPAPQERTEDVPMAEPVREEPPATPVSAAPEVPTESPDKRRQRLFSALKPYLSQNRAKALDSMAAVAALLDGMKHL